MSRIIVKYLAAGRWRLEYEPQPLHQQAAQRGKEEPMSRYYEMALCVRGAKPDRVDAIKEDLEAEWPFDEWEPWGDPSLVRGGCRALHRAKHVLPTPPEGTRHPAPRQPSRPPGEESTIADRQLFLPVAPGHLLHLAPAL